MTRINEKKIMEQLTAMQTMMQSIIEEQQSLREDISALQKNRVSATKSTAKKTASSKQTTPKTTPKTKQPTQAQLDARKAWGEAQHARAEARKALFNVVESPEYKKEWAKWQKTKAYKESKGAERKALNKAKHAEIVAKLSK